LDFIMLRMNNSQFVEYTSPGQQTQQNLCHKLCFKVSSTSL
jgi:hypothetical protein